MATRGSPKTMKRSCLLQLSLIFISGLLGGDFRVSSGGVFDAAPPLPFLVKAVVYP